MADFKKILKKAHAQKKPYFDTVMKVYTVCYFLDLKVMSSTYVTLQIKVTP